MESRAFIVEAKTLIEEIRLVNITSTNFEDEQNNRQNIQKKLNNLFSGLQNPTLPSAFNLRDAAMNYGFTVAPQVLHRLAQFDTI